MLVVQLGLCLTCSETTLLVFPCEGSNVEFLSDDRGVNSNFNSVKLFYK